MMASNEEGNVLHLKSVCICILNLWLMEGAQSEMMGWEFTENKEESKSSGIQSIIHMFV